MISGLDADAVVDKQPLTCAGDVGQSHPADRG